MLSAVLAITQLLSLFYLFILVYCTEVELLSESHSPITVDFVEPIQCYPVTTGTPLRGVKYGLGEENPQFSAYISLCVGNDTR